MSDVDKEAIERGDGVQPRITFLSGDHSRRCEACDARIARLRIEIGRLFMKRLYLCINCASAFTEAVDEAIDEC